MTVSVNGHIVDLFLIYNGFSFHVHVHYETQKFSTKGLSKRHYLILDIILYKLYMMMILKSLIVSYK